ncbi:uncharacterized protein Z520_10204 [Fonsecaea multimorphosa CBS 102226]|uniref:Uncharacterized protein n=1 Tax=Fonsecaea multimorphosa CBS 102226 TaxID=1442371 RepID=A0A0D2JLI7_9EURO|nr:uncharacterized protein Z520_10204 [Fonsecaea multimorphosa CBS 102226]KIX94177.1 hypothetical protein Z520_10204 [Fonsecaea multimorphosa CBS 102226]OAL19530.1 hypothetical protein AYO22_09692 [Fonsecaea multimorphosa]
MNRQEFAHLLSQTQSMMAPPRAPTTTHLISDSCLHGSASASSPPLSPRQKFQAHVRTLNDQASTPPRNASTVPKRSPELQHVSSLRVSYRKTPPPKTPCRASPTWEDSELTLKTFNNTHNEPYFITEEREAWSRQSPSRTTMPFADNVFFLQPPDAHSPILQPSKQLRELRPFAPLAHPVDVNERPKTSRGPAHSHSKFTIENADANLREEDLSARASKFAEGSMNARSAGISSTWQEHSSITSCSETESDDDPTPRASPQRSSIDLSEFKPETTIAPTLKQRLFKFGTKARSKENTSKVEGEPAAKKKNGLRKSMSLWNLHSDKRKAADGSESPEKKSSASSHNSDLEVLNDRKRRAEEAYAQQFGMKRRKSNVGLATATSGDHALEEMEATTGSQSQSWPAPNNDRRPGQSPSKIVPADSEWSDSHNDLDHQKRPTRRELEKENQQLRALLRQKQQEKTPQPASSSSRQHTLTPGIVHEDDVSTAKSSAKKQSQKQSGAAAPAVALLPERAALRTLSNTTNQPHVKNKGNGSLVVISTSDIIDQPKHMKKQRRRSSVVRGEGFSHPFSAILEEDEETWTAQARKENQCSTNDTFSPKLVPEMNSGNGIVDVGGVKVKAHAAPMQGKGVQMENWEWPDDVF